MTVAFFNEDIASEIWKHIPFSAMKVVSITSKDFAYNYNKMTINDKATARYNEIGSLSKYCSKIVEETCKKYAYKKPKFISRLSQYVEKEITKKEKFNYYLFGVMVVILTHAANKKYKEILETINGTMYPTCNSDERAIIMFITEMLNASALKTYGASYTWETKRFFKIVTMMHLFKITENQFLKNNNFRKTREEKVVMLKYECNTDKLVPKYFKEAILQLI
tara:strand:+ start:1255 stop:1920 length:666 start_codon:yes stop_codon:yes gene_type:complete